MCQVASDSTATGIAFNICLPLSMQAAAIREPNLGREEIHFSFAGIEPEDFPFSPLSLFWFALLNKSRKRYRAAGDSSVGCCHLSQSHQTLKQYKLQPCLTTVRRVSASSLSHFMWVLPSPPTDECTKSWLYSRGWSSNSALGWTARIGMDIHTRYASNSLGNIEMV